MSVQPTLEDIPIRILSALSKASNTTGADFSYLLHTAQRESSLNANAKASTSTATGLFQFIESTWLGTIKQEGTKFGLEKYASQITQSKSGQFTVRDPKVRQEILDLRKDPEISALLAGVSAQKNASYLKNKLGRAPNSGEIYIAHFLGPKEATRLIQLNELSPGTKAEHIFPSAAKANKNIFYDKNQPYSVSAVYQKLVSLHNSEIKLSAPKSSKAEPEYGNANVPNTQHTHFTKALANPPQTSIAKIGKPVASTETQIGVWGHLANLQSQLAEIENNYLLDKISRYKLVHDLQNSKNEKT